MAAALTIDGLSVDFDGFKAVNSVSMIVDEGELRVLLGANGAGKTTLMDLISGKTKSTGGRVFLYDTEITNLGGAQNRARRRRPQVSDPERVQGPDGAAQSRSGELQPRYARARQSGLRLFARRRRPRR